MRITIPALLVITILGCSDSTGPGSIAGTYRLRTIASNPLPTVVSGVEFLSSTLVMRDEGTYTQTVIFRQTPGAGQSEEVVHEGRYTLVGIQLTFEGDLDDAEGTFQNGVIGLDLFGGTWAFRK